MPPAIPAIAAAAVAGTTAALTAGSVAIAVFGSAAVFGAFIASTTPAGPVVEVHKP